MHNRHILRTSQDVPTTTWIENSSSILHNCIESTLEGIQRVVIFKDNVLVYVTAKEQINKPSILVRKSLTQSQSKAFFEYSILNERIALDPELVEKIKNCKSAN